MYPLIVLILVISVAVNMMLGRWERAAAGATRCAPMRRSVAADPSAVSGGGLLVVWQVVFWLVGRDALLPP